MKFIPPLVVAILFAGVAHAAEPLRPFYFKGIVAGQPITAADKACSLGGNKSYCFVDSVVAGVTLKEPPIVSIEGGSLKHVIFRTSPNHFEALERGFIEQYGPPCSRSTRKLIENDIIFDYPVLHWCFSTGGLEMNQYVFGRGLMEVRYTDKTVEHPGPPAMIVRPAPPKSD